MFLDVVYPAPRGPGSTMQGMIHENLVPQKPDAFVRLPVNLTRDEIRAMVRDLLG